MVSTGESLASASLMSWFSIFGHVVYFCLENGLQSGAALEVVRRYKLAYLAEGASSSQTEDSRASRSMRINICDS